MKKHQLTALLLTISLLSSAALAGCAKKDETTSTASTVTETSKDSSSKDSSEESSEEDDGLIPKDGGFTTVSYQFSEDQYRTFYEIFPYSFYDSDGDGIGDLNGITEKLDYLNDGDTTKTGDLGIDGIWLMPIMQSPSYHKYNVADYYTVDKAYGTNDDFKKLLDEAHKRHINVIIDLVINHTSRECEWFQKALEELKEGKTDGYAEYYHFEENRTDDGWRKAGVGDWYYEGDFDDDMPDLNLKNPAVREELEKIVKFWLDMGVDGFRLDAVMWFESIEGKKGQHDDAGSIEDLKWLYQYAKTVKQDVYMVGECWSDSPNTIADYYKSGLDSFFNFQAQGAKGRIVTRVNAQNAAGYVEFLESWQNQIDANNPDAIDAKFLSNHDTVRSAEFLLTETKKRLAAMLYLISPGNPFIYYGEEIEAAGVNPPDPDVRRGMYWSTLDAKGYVPKIPGGTKMDEEPEISVEAAQKDPDSLLNFYKRLIVLRNQNPEIARGKIKPVLFGDDKTTVAGYVSVYKKSAVFVLYNLGKTSETVEIPKDTFTVSKVSGYVLGHVKDEANDKSYSDEIKLDGQKLTMPAESVFVLR